MPYANNNPPPTTMPNITNTSFFPSPLPSGSYTSSTTSDFTMTIWNSNGCPKQSISAITDSLPSTSLLFMTETWLLSPSRFPTAWHQYHTYGQPVENSYRGQMGITLLVNPDFPFPVTHFPSESPYVLSCQVGPFLIHCVYLPPATLSATDAMEIIRTLPMQTHSSQTNTIICGDINARHQRLLGYSRTTTRVTLLHEWATENGMICWNSRLAFGVATYCSQSRVHHRTGINFSSIIDLFFSSQELSNPELIVRQDLNMGSDHHPVSLSCVIPTAAPPPPTHPRQLWNLSRLSEPDCRYPSLFRERIKPLHDRLLSYTSPDRPFSTCPPDIDELATALTDTIYTCLDDSVGERKPKLHKNDWFWTPALQSAFDYRESCRRKWHHSVGVDKGLRWQAYSAASDAYRRDISRRRRETWKQFSV
ncbi:hypothetical protein G6F43_012541 [Rhizopus delemar]|nr:hypothetical protein G6F43_012541 [Rhizopus delemar]